MKQNQISKNAPLLVGMIIDVSSSMRRNWKNEEGEQLPQIEIIKDGLNRQIRKIKTAYLSKRTKQDFEIFCLGMGFKRPQRAMRFVDLSANREKSLEGTAETLIDTEVVCDILALTEIIPTKADLDEIDRIINSKWSEYSDKLLARVVFRESLYDDLVTFIRESLLQTALKKLKGGFSSKILTLLVTPLQKGSPQKRATLI